MHLKYINNCRICNNPGLKPAFSLGSQFLHGSFIDPSKNIYPPTRKIPVELVRCDPMVNNGCGLLQLKHTVDPSILYAAYGYRSSTSQTMKNWLKSIVDSVMKLKPDLKSVQDIGANDLFTLKQFPNTIERVGVDGCDIINRVDQENIRVYNELYPRKYAYSPYTTFDCILSIACLYDIENINEFVACIASELDNNGIWVFEVAYLPTILNKVDYSHYVHEHLETYTLSVLTNLLKRHGLHIFDVNITETNGGSILCYATHESSTVFSNKENSDRIQKIRLAEFDMELDTDKPYNQFSKKMIIHGMKLRSLVAGLVNKGKTVHLLSASTKGNVILQYAGIDNTLIKYASERSPEKVGCRTLGTNIEIISEEDSRKMNPDYYLVLIPAFKNEILEREKEFISKGGKFIFPFPDPITILP